MNFLTAPVLYGLTASLIAMTGVATVQTARLSSAKRVHAELREVLAQERQLAAEAALKAAEEQRVEERRRSIAAAEVDRAGKEKLDRLRSALDGAAAVAAGLRADAAAAASRCRWTGEEPGATDDREAAANPAMVLADVLGRMEARGRELALLADERGIAGETCERFAGAMNKGGP